MMKIKPIGRTAVAAALLIVVAPYSHAGPVGDVSIEILPGATDLALTWGTTNDYKYTVQSRDGLIFESWTNTAAAGIIGTGGDVTVTTAVDQVLHFYRVVGDVFIQNWGFEFGTLASWTTTGNAFDNDPASTNWPSAGYEGTYLVNTFLGSAGESGVGTLKSQNFTLGDDQIVQLRMGGWSGGAGVSNGNYVTLNRVSDDLELDRIYAPGVTSVNVSQAIPVRQMTHGLAGDVDVYVEVVDDIATSFGWLSVDDFRMTAANATFEENNGFEQGTLAGWTKTGNAFDSQPALKTWPSLPNIFAALPSWPSSGFAGGYLVNTFYGQHSTAATGELTSATFTLAADEQLLFRMGGHSMDGGAGTNFCYVTLNRASDNAELDRVWAPGITGDMARRLLTHGEAGSVDVYLYINDNSTSPWSWLSVDEFVPFTADTTFGSNGGFELGDWTDWTVDGVAFGPSPVDVGPQGRDGWTGQYYAGSAVGGGETAVGTLTSQTFSLGTNDTVSFLVSGWSDVAGVSTNWNYVALKRASDDSEIDRVWAPNVTVTMVERSFSSSTNVAENVYIEVVDNADTNGFAWISVDDFQLN